MTRAGVVLLQQKDIWQGSIEHFLRTEVGTATREQVKAIKEHSQTFSSQVFDGLEKDLRERGYLPEKGYGNDKENARPRSAKKDRDGKNKDGSKEELVRLQMLRERCASLRTEVQEKQAERACVEERVTKKCKEDPSFTDVSELEKMIQDLRSQVAGNAEDTKMPERLLPADRVANLLSNLEKIKTIASSQDEARQSSRRNQQMPKTNAKPDTKADEEHWPLLQHVNRVD